MIRIETRRHGNPDISIAPLVDCVFLLLIFFLLTSSFSDKWGIKIDLPRSAADQAAKKETIEIGVSASGEIYVQGQPTVIGELAQALRDMAAKRGKLPVFIKADRTVPLEKVTDIIDSVRTADLLTVSIATQRKPQKKTEE